MGGETKHLWDSKVPETPDDIIKLLQRRIDVHAYWREFCIAGSDRAKLSEKYGVGTAESHQRYIDQYEGAISVLRGIT